MLLHLVLGSALVVQAAAPARATSAPDSHSSGVRVWLPDTLVHVGEHARVYVRLATTGHLFVLHADAGGRIRVLFPSTPTTDDVVPGSETFELAGSGGGGTFPILTPGAGLVLAVYGTRPFDLDGLVQSGAWDYAHALLFQPTAGNLFAALLDVADRVSGGRAYRYDQAAYRTPGASNPRLASGEAVCLECFAARSSRPAPTIAVNTGTVNAGTMNVVDCSNATPVSSFCGVEDNRTYVTEQAAPAPLEVSGYPVVEPVYVPLFIPVRRRFQRPHRPPPTPALAYDHRLRALPGGIVPPPPRRRPPIAVPQPRVPTRSRARTPDTPQAPPDVAPPRAARPAVGATRRTPATRPATPAAATARWERAPFAYVAPQTLPDPRLRPATAPVPATIALPRTRAPLAPSGSARAVAPRR